MTIRRKNIILRSEAVKPKDKDKPKPKPKHGTVRREAGDPRHSRKMA